MGAGQWSRISVMVIAVRTKLSRTLAIVAVCLGDSVARCSVLEEEKGVRGAPESSPATLASGLLLGDGMRMTQRTLSLLPVNYTGIPNEWHKVGNFRPDSEKLPLLITNSRFCDEEGQNSESHPMSLKNREDSAPCSLTLNNWRF